MHDPSHARPRRLFSVDESHRMAEAGHARVDVFRTPRGDAYADVSPAGRGRTLRPLAFPDVAIDVDELFT